MATDLVSEERRMRSALREGQYVEAFHACERLKRGIRTAIAESSKRVNNSRTNGNGLQLPNVEKMRLSKLAHHIGVDTRTLRSYIDDEPFVEHPTERVTLVRIPKFKRWYAARGCTLRRGRRRNG